MARIVIATVGSLGDLLPLVNLAMALKNRGHKVIIICPLDCKKYVTQKGLECRCYGFKYIDYLKKLPSYKDAVEWLGTTLEEQYEVTNTYTKNADILISSMFQLAAASIAEAKHIPYFYTVFSPVALDSRCKLVQCLPTINTPTIINLIARSIRDRTINKILVPRINHYRVKFKLDPIKDIFKYVIYTDKILAAFDTELFLNKIKFNNAVITGSWQYKNNMSLVNTDLIDYIKEEKPPIYIGFGSSSLHNLSPSIEQLITYANTKNERFIIQNSYSESMPKRIKDNVILTGYIDHSILFKFVKCVVHHGGIGTTTSAAISGVPQIIAPHMGDQFYTAISIYKNGLGPPPIKLDFRITHRLDKSINKLTINNSYFNKAKELRNHIKEKNGINLAVSYIENTNSKQVI